MAGQDGYERGGWYTPQWVDSVRQPVGDRREAPVPASASRLLPQYQHVAAGDLICDGPDYASYFWVLRVDRGRAVIYRSIRHPRRGSPIDPTDRVLNELAGIRLACYLGLPKTRLEHNTAAAAINLIRLDAW